MQDKITQILKAISDPTRRELFHVLLIASTAMPISQLASKHPISRQGITKHLKVLNEAGLISIESSGRERYCSADAAPLKEVQKWLGFYQQFWDDKLDHLGTYLENS